MRALSKAFIKLKTHLPWVGISFWFFLLFYFILKGSTWYKIIQTWYTSFSYKFYSSLNTNFR
jgi:hypothetical protein